MTFQPGGEVEISAENLQIKTRIEHLSIAPRIANTQRHIYLENGAKLETNNNEAVDRVSAYFQTGVVFSQVHRLEKSWVSAILALTFTLVFIWTGIEYGVPFAAKWAVKAVPYSVEQEMGEHGLETLDKWLFSPSELSGAKQRQLENYFNDLLAVVSQGKYDYHLIFRSSQQMGPNALALPGGIVLLTDSLVELAEDDQQLIAVLAHEIGHIKFRHGLRSLFQDSVTAIFMAGVLGDISSISSLSVVLPTVLVESRYSREFEFEADLYAIQYLQGQNIKLEKFSRILSLLEQSHGDGFEFDYLSSHPSMQKRLGIIQNYSVLEQAPGSVLPLN